MTFSLQTFRALCPQFSSVADATVQAQAVQAECYIADLQCGDACALNLMVAHLLQLSANAAAGTPGGQITSASIDKVSVTVAQAPGTTSYTYWLNSTPYGQQLAALLARCAAGGTHVGGLPERAAFRNVGGIFPRRGRLW